MSKKCLEKKKLETVTTKKPTIKTTKKFPTKSTTTATKKPKTQKPIIKTTTKKVITPKTIEQTTTKLIKKNQLKSDEGHLIAETTIISTPKLTKIITTNLSESLILEKKTTTQKTTTEIIPKTTKFPLETNLRVNGCFEIIDGYIMNNTAGGLERGVSLEECQCFCVNSLLVFLLSFFIKFLLLITLFKSTFKFFIDFNQSSSI